ncbi:MAG: glycosyltransferase family 2 protein [Acidimicrobiia bacterium]|nr:glycosyltransferase family 2 protein [Acidimicrobiia bacterium]
MRLGIVIPALDEEQTIGATIERTLVATPGIVESSPVTGVEITVVSDGSTDRTAEIARSFGAEVGLIVFEHNRGYGAAIKAGWDAMPDADVVAFLDADGTCNPAFFGPLTAALVAHDADIAVGCRLNRGSHMPWIRRLGNRLFATLLSTLASSAVRDTASGMRVVRRSALPDLMPLPDGLHFTPAMSARALLGGELKIVEIEMPYEERHGRSKLHVIRDGGRFLDTILRTAALYRPSRLLGAAGVLALLIAAGLLALPTVHYLQHGTVEEWMIYRFVVGNLLGVVGVLLLCAGHLAGTTVDALLFAGRPRSRLRSLAARALAGPVFWCVEGALLLIGGLLVLPSFLQLVRTGSTDAHWSRFIAMSFLYETAAVLAVTKIAGAFLGMAVERAEYLRNSPPLVPEPTPQRVIAQSTAP